MLNQFTYKYKTQGRGLYSITSEIVELISTTNVITGLCHIFVQHTSCSLIISENTDPLVLSDLENFMFKLIPEDNNLYKHVEEGSDDMPAHIRNVLTSSFLNVPIHNSKLALGTWQALFLWEHRSKPHERSLIITVNGE